MSASEEFVDFILDQLEPLASTSGSPVYSQTFFGGKALRQDNIQFAMIMGDTLYLCVDDSTRPDFEKIGMQPFSYQTKKGKVNVRKYFAAPADWLEDQDILISHVARSIETARRAK